MKKTLLTAALVAALFSAKAQVFTETLGTVTANTKVADHDAAKGFANTGKLKFSGSAEVQMQGSSADKYSTATGSASGGANLRFANVAETDFVISGINTSNVNNPVVGFGILKGPNSSNGAELVVEYSTDGKTWFALKYPLLPTGEGTGLVWNYRETSAVPKAEKLSIRFRQTGNFVVFRVDDIAIVSKG
ncbi:hypothetical protein [Pedobacter xixiisoli]|uniref:F5/8 type C domain-containing protein n=1 Tax=Pedobacter xixiisoli TaxID=1476464 RepID=A0A285ZSA3_9SPHI|nr:hypothetical protein [Pedobacter xixiisoli]SOD12534.1 hypothetical protein SAMN06297358_0718 [Pedobacter xixiisoli]